MIDREHKIQDKSSEVVYSPAPSSCTGLGKVGVKSARACREVTRVTKETLGPWPLPPLPLCSPLDSSSTGRSTNAHAERNTATSGYPVPAGLPAVSLLVFVPSVIKLSHEWSYPFPKWRILCPCPSDTLYYLDAKLSWCFLDVYTGYLRAKSQCI